MIAGTGTTGLTALVTGTSYTITEAASGTTKLPQYSGTLACTDSSGANRALVLNTAFSLQDDDVVTCTLTNTAKAPTVRRSKALGTDGRINNADQIKTKSHMIPAEPVAQVVARGEADLGFQQVSELLPVQGIDFVGEIPDETQQLTPFSAGIVTGTKEHAAAQALMDYLTSAEAAPVIRRTGLSPAAALAH